VLAASGTATGEQPQTALRSGTIALANASALLGALTGDDRYRSAAERLVADRARTGTTRPLGHADALAVALGLQQPSREIVVVASETPVLREFRTVAATGRRPGSVVVTVTPEQARAWSAAGFSLLDGRDVLDPAAYVCHDHVCALPARSTGELTAQLASS
jgi:uncharacterized protein YyaL (SSP411 family)